MHDFKFWMEMDDSPEGSVICLLKNRFIFITLTVLSGWFSKGSLWCSIIYFIWKNLILPYSLHTHIHKQTDLHTCEKSSVAYSGAIDTTNWDVAQVFLCIFANWLNPYETNMFNYISMEDLGRILCTFL